MFNMVNQLPYGQYHITNLENNDPLDVSKISNLPDPLPPAPVILGLACRVVMPILCVIYEDSTDIERPQFTVVPVDVGVDTYVILVDEEKRLTCGDNIHPEERVFAFDKKPAEVWVVTYRETQKAYTIERREGHLAWTAPCSEPEHPRQVWSTCSLTYGGNYLV
ncbi:hypothetical protein EDC04DRAFT_2727610 [Pisolithus marmoratus]|nr:hypothetical protein EDC04DRAFT_2727610 [Pisolithus marmoratus]